MRPFPYLLVFTVLFSSLAPANAGTVTYMGDAIGPNSSATDGNGVSGAMNVSAPEWDWNGDIGTPAFQYNSDGKAKLDSLRAITAVWRRNTNPTDWDKHNWSIDIWRKNEYLAKAAPLHTVNMGATPSNWSGFKSAANGDVIPDTQPFGTPGVNVPVEAKSYEMIFDLSQHSVLQNPLPDGEYIISFTSRGGPEAIGDAAIGASLLGQGPDPYFSNLNIAPGPVIGRLTDVENYRWPMNLDIRSDLLNGTFADGLTHWESGGPDTVELIEINGNAVTKFTAGSPAVLSQKVITDPMDLLSFDYKFEQAEGQFDVLLGNDLIASLQESELFSDDWSSFSVTLEDPGLWGRQDELSFVFDGQTGSQFFLDNVRLGVTAIPEPSALLLLGIATAAVGLRRGRRRVNAIPGSRRLASLGQ